MAERTAYGIAAKCLLGPDLPGHALKFFLLLGGQLTTPDCINEFWLQTDFTEARGQQVSALSVFLENDNINQHRQPLPCPTPWNQISPCPAGTAYRTTLAPARSLLAKDRRFRYPEAHQFLKSSHIEKI